MHVDISHHVDASEPDDEDGYYYAYTLYHFSDGRDRLLARSYDDEAEQAHFLSIEVEGRARTMTDADLRHPLLLAAAAYLAGAGKRRLRWLSGRGDGYEPLPGQPTIGSAEAP
ncbi:MULTISPECIES: hypothetical protein [Xanthomonas]|uniref:Uncharacterized protein n=1 Tax=Xanthomonas rydalmerensis TaxID=3046274 RepID=A0ABZ0JN70_9XANT|nr:MULTISPECIES: hypothetical protein [unclassified Xanthomonas]MBB5943886.1 hypothetical protein [Xanthomonas sp. 3307]WOS41254.1 hypothetical protein QN243_01855 [Xanthomonas sp. DM-2023]WOS45439.1 hypothetical protein QN242_01855 [Xanthomonas sp. DM-2023]WOS49618.1 hypothetical protein QN240_01855 [Xanthomonas sp. DM-2023]WOS53798.1 hypothetical protein QN244_01855 [Xanthomonas sp. DM-2023]